MITMPFNRHNPLHAALQLLNWAWGTGDIVRVTSTHYYVQRQFGTGRYSYRVDGDKVTARRHSAHF